MSNETVKLSDFLEQNECSHEFVENFNKYYHLYWVEDVDVRRAIFYAFDWVATKQGHEFWSNINKEWVSLPHKEYDMLWLLEEGETK